MSQFITWSISTRPGRSVPQVIITVATEMLKPGAKRQTSFSLKTTDPMEAKRRALRIYLDFCRREYGHETDPEEVLTKTVRTDIQRLQTHPDGSRTVLFDDGPRAELVTYDRTGRETNRVRAERYRQVRLTPQEEASIIQQNHMLEQTPIGRAVRLKDLQPTAAARKPKPEPKVVTFMDLFDRYATYRLARKNIREQTLIEFGDAAKAFDDFVRQRAVTELKRADVEAFIAFLMTLPDRRTVPPAMKKEPLAVLAKWRKKTGAPGLAKASIGKMIAGCRAAWTYAIQLDEFDITKPIFAGTITKDEIAQDQQARGHLTDSEVRTLIAALPRLKSPEDRLYASILLYSGCRFDEVRQAKLKRHDGVLCFDLLDSDPKTVESRRLIPVHPELLKLGIEQKRWIKTVKRNQRTDVSDAANKRLNFWMKKATRNPRHSVHWIRHTFITKLSTAGVPEQFVRQLAGHAAKRDAHSAYSHLLRMVHELKAAIDKLDFSEKPTAAPLALVA